MKKTRNSTAFRALWKNSIAKGGRVVCGICEKPILKTHGNMGISVDHIKPKSLGGTGESQNLQPAHSICNRIKGNKYGDTIKAL